MSGRVLKAKRRIGNARKMRLTTAYSGGSKDIGYEK